MIELIADAVTAATTAPVSGTSGADPNAPWWTVFFRSPLYLIGVMLIVMMFLTKNKATKGDKERQNLLKSLKKGDKVQTIGGLIATVVSADDGEVLLKVDETTNTKMRFSRTAIHRVIEPS